MTRMMMKEKEEERRRVGAEIKCRICQGGCGLWKRRTKKPEEDEEEADG